MVASSAASSVRQTCRPRPSPPARSSRVPGSSTARSRPGRTPGPKSRTRISTRSPRRRAAMRTGLPGACRSALASRFVTTCASVLGEPDGAQPRLDVGPHVHPDTAAQHHQAVDRGRHRVGTPGADAVRAGGLREHAVEPAQFARDDAAQRPGVRTAAQHRGRAGQSREPVAQVVVPFGGPGQPQFRPPQLLLLEALLDVQPQQRPPQDPEPAAEHDARPRPAAAPRKRRGLRPRGRQHDRPGLGRPHQREPRPDDPQAREATRGSRGRPGRARRRPTPARTPATRRATPPRPPRRVRGGHDPPGRPGDQHRHGAHQAPQQAGGRGRRGRDQDEEPQQDPDGVHQDDAGRGDRLVGRRRDRGPSRSGSRAGCTTRWPPRPT